MLNLTWHRAFSSGVLNQNALACNASQACGRALAASVRAALPDGKPRPMLWRGPRRRLTPMQAPPPTTPRRGRPAPAPLRLQGPPSGTIATLMTRTSSSRSSPPPTWPSRPRSTPPWRRVAIRRPPGRDAAGSDAAAGEQEEGQDGGGGVRDPGYPTGYPTSVRFDMHRALDDLAGLTTEQPHD